LFGWLLVALSFVFLNCGVYWWEKRQEIPKKKMIGERPILIIRGLLF